MLYLVVLVYLASLALLYDLNKSNKKYYSVNIFIAYFILSIIAGIRFEMGSDSFAYKYYVENEVRLLKDLDFEFIFGERFQPAWVILSSLAKSLGDYLYLQLFVAFTSMFSVYFFIKKNTSYWATFTLFFFISFYHYFSVEILRESLAISIFLFAMTAFDRHKFLSFFLCLSAFLVHKFAVFIVLIYLFMLFRIGLIGILISMFFVVIITLALDDPINTIAIAYSVIKDVEFSNYELDVNLSLFGYAFYFTKIIIPLYLIYFCHTRKILISKYINNNIFYVFCIFCSTIFIIRIISIPYVERLTNYFILFYLLFASTLLINFLKKQDFLIKNLIFILFVNLSIAYSWLPLMRPDAQTGIPGYSRYYPYYSYLNKEIDPNRQKALEERFQLGRY